MLIKLSYNLGLCAVLSQNVMWRLVTQHYQLTATTSPFLVSLPDVVVLYSSIVGCHRLLIFAISVSYSWTNNDNPYNEGNRSNNLP